MQYAIQVKDMSFAYKGRKIFDNIHFALPQGSITAVTGKNGAGKSTLLQLILGLMKPQKGEVRLLGMKPKNARKKVAYVAQTDTLDWHFPITVEEFAMMGRYGKMGFFKRPSAIDRAKVAQILDEVHLSDKKQETIAHLSGGEKKRLLLARALLQEADLLVLDEPFNAIDTFNKEWLIELLRRLKREKAVSMLVVLHHEDEVKQLCDYRLELSDGMISQIQMEV